MGMVIGIDVGGSTTKIGGLKEDKLFSPVWVKANDPVASIYGAFGKFIATNKLTLDDIEQVKVTGVGSSYISQPLYGIPTTKIDEFRAIGKGGCSSAVYTRQLWSAWEPVPPLSCEGRTWGKHMGGTGVGGGTLLGLSNKMLNTAFRRFNRHGGGGRPIPY